jgi:hypothetical protein
VAVVLIGLLLVALGVAVALALYWRARAGAGACRDVRACGVRCVHARARTGLGWAAGGSEELNRSGRRQLTTRPAVYCLPEAEVYAADPDPIEWLEV